MEQRIEELAEEMATVMRYLFAQIPRIKPWTKEVNALSKADQHDLTVILSEKLIEISPKFMGVQDLIPALIRSDYDTATAIAQRMMPHMNYRFSAVGPDHYAVSANPQPPPPRGPAESWFEYLDERFKRAEKEGQVEKNADGTTGLPFFQCQVRLTHGNNIGVGTLSPMAMSADGHGTLLRFRSVNPNPHPDAKGQLIATVTHFAGEDIVAITELEATAQDVPKKESKIWTGG